MNNIDFCIIVNFNKFVEFCTMEFWKISGKGGTTYYLLLLLLLTLPFSVWLSSYPQNPDGAELLMTAIHGGVLHPPGFPLQSWINRLLFLFEPFRNAITLSIFSFVCHLLNVSLIYLISLRLNTDADKNPTPP